MEIIERFKSGVNAASDSFYIIWQHKILLAYFGIVTMVKMILAIWTTSYALHKYTSIIQFFSVNVPLQFALVPLSIFAQVALTHHTAHIFDEQQTSVQESIKATMRKWQPILAWSGITFLVSLLFGQLARVHYISPIEMSFGILGVAWALLTIFMPTSIALEQLSLFEHFQHSVIVMRNYLFKLLGGLFWIGIVFLLCMAPFGGAWVVAYFAPSLYYNMLFLQIISCLELVVQWSISSACTVFKAMLYLQYKQGIEELQQLQYPRM